MTIALYPGSFDPITNGHLDVAVRASRLFEKIIIGIYHSPAEKILLFTTGERIKLASEALSGNSNIEVMSYTELTGDFARRINAQVMIRGLRMGGDFEREFTLNMMNKKLFPDLEQVCFMCSVEFQFVSSSLLKEAASLGGDISGLVPANVAQALKNKFGKKVA
ncbi:MAG: pantetheine-phosphate adenylyltransferase [Dehalococcoidales bacterium]|nr:pantetheine-phosphate adenylyltransferase [Dehalococcoidales bacterium]